MPGLYVHIPFCEAACPYCDFAFVVGRGSQADRYVSAVETEWASRSSEHPQSLDTIYFGGGTPSDVPPEYLDRLLRRIDQTVEIQSDAEITAEANPNDLERFHQLREIGFTRLSLGIQSTDDRTLTMLGRNHRGEDAGKAITAARSAGFENVSIDLILGVPGQDQSQWTRDLRDALALDPSHISIYGLTIEPRTAYARQQASGEIALPLEDDQARMYEQTQQLTEQAGYEHYEISNFALPGFESRHNLSCWRGTIYVGIGLSAHSYSGNQRSWNVRNLSEYLSRVESGQSPIDDTENIGVETQRIERIMLGLRTRDGIDPDLVEGATITSRLLSENLLERMNNRLRLTRRGKVLADSICAELVGSL